MRLQGRLHEIRHDVVRLARPVAPRRRVGVLLLCEVVQLVHEALLAVFPPPDAVEGGEAQPRHSLLEPGVKPRLDTEVLHAHGHEGLLVLDVALVLQLVLAHPVHLQLLQQPEPEDGGPYRLPLRLGERQVRVRERGGHRPHDGLLGELLGVVAVGAPGVVRPQRQREVVRARKGPVPALQEHHVEEAAAREPPLVAIHVLE
mmetsp:Transcript_38811/g.123313  ORF Transcript_38811/g.123313 Transcript_38811/m.123313 type:complete len:202 (-) Transcript_38811:2395-3000(-)